MWFDTMMMMTMMMTNIVINNTLVNCTYVKHMFWKVYQGKMLCNNMSQSYHYISSKHCEWYNQTVIR